MSDDRRRTDLIVVNPTMTHTRQDVGASWIAAQEMERGVASERGPTGGHLIVRRSGTVELGRDLRARGQVVYDYNDVAVYVYLVGGATRDGSPTNNFTAEQYDSLLSVVRFLKLLYPRALLVPRDELDGRQPCALDVWEWQTSFGGEGDARAFFDWCGDRRA